MQRGIFATSGIGEQQHGYGNPVPSKSLGSGAKDILHCIQRMDNVGRNLETNFLTVNLKFSLRFSSDRIGTESTEKGSQNGPPVVRRSKGQAAKRWSVGDTFSPRFSQRPQGRHFAWGRGNGNVCQLTVCFSPQKDSLLVHLCIAAPSQANP
eukprot:EG_transcript_23339